MAPTAPPPLTISPASPEQFVTYIALRRSPQTILNLSWAEGIADIIGNVTQTLDDVTIVASGLIEADDYIATVKTTTPRRSETRRKIALRGSAPEITDPSITGLINEVLDDVLAVAYQFNGALSVSELMGSSLLFQSAVRVLARARGQEEEGSTAVTPFDPEQEMQDELAAGSQVL